MAELSEVRINSRTALLCKEFIHKSFASSCFDLSDRIESDPLPIALPPFDPSKLENFDEPSEEEEE